MNSILPFCKHIIAGMLAFGTDIICLRKMLVQSILFCQVVYTLLPSRGIEEMLICLITKCAMQAPRN